MKKNRPKRKIVLVFKKQRLDKKKTGTKKQKTASPGVEPGIFARASNSSTQTRTQSLLCMRCDLWEGFSEFAVHQGKDGRKTRSDCQISEIFLHKSIISCKHQYFTVFLPFLVFFSMIDYLHGHPSSLEFPRLVI